MSVCPACRESTSGSCWQHPLHYGPYPYPTNAGRPPITEIAFTERGWECPRCHSVYAPWVWKCDRCAAPTKEDADE